MMGTLDTMTMNWDHVAEALKARAAELGLIQAELARRSGVSDTALRGFYNGRPVVRQDVKWKLASALRWPTDAIDRLAEGEEPDESWDTAPALSSMTAAEDLEALRVNDPEQYEVLVAQLHLAAERARRNN